MVSKGSENLLLTREKKKVTFVSDPVGVHDNTSLTKQPENSCLNTQSSAAVRLVGKSRSIGGLCRQWECDVEVSASGQFCCYLF